jgi:hypothetical protein
MSTNEQEIVSTGIRDRDIHVVDAAPIDERTPRQKWIDSLRDFASWLEYHPDLAVPSTLKLYVFPTIEEMEMYAREMGKCRKSADESYFNLTKDFLPSVQYEPTWYRNQVCERVVVGQKEVTEDIVEVVGQRTVTKDVVEWKCPKVLQQKLAEGAIE